MRGSEANRATDYLSIFMLTNKDLKHWYKHYNKKFWQNRLPDIPVRFANTGKNWGQTHFEGHEPAYIEISREAKKSRAVSLMTLLHEQVHVFLPDRIIHGPKFEAEMLRLAKAGAFKGLW